VIALLALLLSAGGGAYAATRSTGSAVNIVDPVTAANKVSSGGSLQVSGSVNSTPTSSTNDLHGITGVDPTTQAVRRCSHRRAARR
jgi:hypothetical protein